MLGDWNSLVGKVSEEVLPPMPAPSPSCKMSLLTLPVESFLLHGRVVWTSKEGGGGSCSCLVQLLQEEPQRWQDQILCCGGSRHYGSGHGLPHGRLNMRKNDVPWRVMLQENTCLNRCTDLCLMFMMWLNEATVWPAVVVVAVLLMGGQTGDHQGPDTILRILWAWASSLLYAT